MKRYITGKPVCDVKDIIPDGKDYILILDEGCFSCLDEIAQKRPVAALSDYNLFFSHIPAFFQMLSIPLIFMPENKNRAYAAYYERAHGLIDNNRTDIISTIEEVRNLHRITIDTYLSVAYLGGVGNANTHDTINSINKVDGFQVLTSIKSIDEGKFSCVNSDGIGMIFSEFIFFNYKKYPTCDEQRSTLEMIFKKNPSEHYTVRLFDIKYDKIPKWLHGVKLEENDNPLFEKFFYSYLVEQLKCLCDLAEKYPIFIIIPGIRDLNDIIYIRKCIDNVESSYGHLLKIGVLIENVSVVEKMPCMLDIVDFFSVGSSDLTSSFFGKHRTHIYDPDQLARILNDDNYYQLLANIKLFSSSKHIRIAGQLPVFPGCLEKLIVIGYRHFSVNPYLVGQIKYQIRNLISLTCSDVK